MQKKIYFAHGKESGPWGHKIQALAAVGRACGFAIESPDYSFTYDPDARVQHLLDLAPQADCLVLVGSSMGGYVSAIASRTLAPAGLFLLAPAVYMPGYDAEPAPAARLLEVVHGWRDTVIPVENAIRLARQHQARLHILDSEHTLNDQIPYLEVLFRRFLEEAEAIATVRG